ncbi:hypothetical protein [Streptomyces sp. NPDC002611]
MKKSTKIVLALVAVVTFGGLISEPSASASPSPKTTQAAPSLPTRACPEDGIASRNCYWDAAKRGNGKGYSYFVDRGGKVTYLNPKLNDEAKRKAFATTKEKAGWEYWGVVFGHQFCWAKVGDTSYIECFDGFRETS